MNCETCGNKIEDFAICSDCEIDLRNQIRRTPVELAAEKLLNGCEIALLALTHEPVTFEDIEVIKQAIEKAKTPNNQLPLKNPTGPDEHKSSP